MSNKVSNIEAETNVVSAGPITRYSEVSEDNLDKIVAMIFKNSLPCIKAMQLDRMPGSEAQKVLKQIIRTECIFHGIPLIFVLDGAFRARKDEYRVNYYGPTAIQMYIHLAEKNNLALPIKAEVKFIIDDLRLLLESQDILRKYFDSNRRKTSKLWAKIATPSSRDGAGLDFPPKMRIIPLDPSRIDGIEAYTASKERLFVPIGDYTICGVTGEMIFNDDMRHKYTYYVNPERTTLTKGEAASPYALNPLQFLETKFYRMALRNFYGHNIPLLPQLDSDDDEVSEAEIQRRAEEVRDFHDRRAERLNHQALEARGDAADADVEGTVLEDLEERYKDEVN